MYRPGNQGYGHFQTRFQGGRVDNSATLKQNQVNINCVVDKDYYAVLKNALGGTDTNSFHPHYGKYPLEPIHWMIDENDLVCRFITPTEQTARSADSAAKKARRSTSRYAGFVGDDGAPKIFNNLNGAGAYTFQYSESPLDLYPDAEDKKALIRESFEFVGFAQGRWDFSKGGLQDTSGRVDIAVQIGGTLSIINTGIEPIFTGQYVMWDVPDPALVDNYPPRHIEDAMLGKDTKQILFSIAPFSGANVISMASLYSAHREKFERNEGGAQPYRILPDRPPIYTVSSYYDKLYHFVASILAWNDVYHQEAAANPGRGAGINFANASMKEKTAAMIKVSTRMGTLAPETPTMTHVMKRTFHAIQDVVFSCHSTWNVGDGPGRELSPSDIRTFDSTFPSFLNAGFQVLADKQSRIIGRALNSGASGKMIDLAIHMNRTA